MENMVYIWLGAMLLFLIVEAVTVGLTSIWFAAGSLAAFVVAIVGGPFWLQLVLFLLISGVMLAFTRPLAKRYLNSRRKATNADRVLNMVGIVTEDIDNVAAQGTVSVDGKLWTARSKTGNAIGKGKFVRPVAIEGVKLLVVPAEEPSKAPQAEEIL